MRPALPRGTVTFLFTDVEGSTKLLHELGAEKYTEALAAHRRVIRETFARHGGVEVDTQGDAFFVAFPTCPGAVDVARQAQAALQSGPIRVRMGIHTGAPHLSDEGYVGQDVHKGARIAAAGHGGQVLLSKEARDLADVDATDLGEHRLKDFDDPVQIFQLGAERFPPLKTISNTNLPRPASSFVGRDTEVEEVVSLLQDGARLLTLTGPGGSGKTRLAIEAAATLVPEFKAGVFWVGLATLRDPALVTDTIAQTLGAKDGLANHIGERELLLLLDNLEQVIESAAELAALVETCPNLKLLITSRESLHVNGEIEYPVLPLAEPDAVVLFCARARTEPDENVHQLCRALDNLPLALELAAARASVLSPKHILERLSQRLDVFKGGRDADPRQQTLRATISWSYELLDAGGQQLFARLAVFAGGCTIDAAEEVTEAELDTLQSLVDKSLVRHTEERFWMLETIREYALEQLERSGQIAELDEAGEREQVRRRHADYYLALAEQLRQHEPPYWYERVDAEHDNFRAALVWAHEKGEAEVELRLATSLALYWAFRGYVDEARRWLEQALAGDADLPLGRAKAHAELGYVSLRLGDYPQARKFLTEALDEFRALGYAAGIGHVLLSLSTVVAIDGDSGRATELAEEAAHFAQERGDATLSFWAAIDLARLALGRGDPERARTLLQDAALVEQRGGFLSSSFLWLTELAFLALYEGDDARALSLFCRSIAVQQQVRIFALLPDCLIGLAVIAAAQAEEERAARLLGAADGLRKVVGPPPRPQPTAWQRDRGERTLGSVRAALGDARFTAARAGGRAMSLERAIAYALDPRLTSNPRGRSRSSET